MRTFYCNTLTHNQEGRVAIWNTIGLCIERKWVIATVKLTCMKSYAVTKQALVKQIAVVPSNRTMLFYSGMTRCFGLKRLASGHHYKICNIRYNAVQIMLVIWDPVLRTEAKQYKIYIKLCKNRWAGDVLAGACVQVAYKNVKYRQKNC
jgi:hypothetical protein